MRCVVLALAAALSATPLAAQTDERPLELPVSLERIREALASDKPSILDRLDLQPTFRVEVQENHPNFGEMLSAEKMRGGPVPPGGLYAYEQQRMLFPNSTPWVMSINTLPVFKAIANAISDQRRERTAAAARAEVERAMAEFCAAQPNGGDGIAGCRTGR
jgi:hypothetical protein